MTTEEIKDKMVNDFRKINYNIINDYEFSSDIDNFQTNNKYAYIYEKKGMYYEIDIDSEYYDSKSVVIETSDVEDFLYNVYALRCFVIAKRKITQVKEKIKNIDLDRAIRIEQFNLLNKINSFYYEKELRMVLNNLHENPDRYNDKYGDNFDFSLLEE